MYPEASKISDIINDAQKIVIVQADNPDADSLGSALAMEHILGDMGKSAYLYCAADIPSYLRYMQGWDRIQNELPSQFDTSVIVDASTMTLLEKLEQSGKMSWLSGKPCIVLDHHASVEKVIPFASVMINDGNRASAGELIYLLSKELKWPLNLQAQEFLMTSILGDTQGLSNQLASSQTYHAMAEMVDAGVSRPALEELRREFSKMPVEIFKYKADLINRAEFTANGRLASVEIPQDEINKYSPLYNPAPLIQNDMLQTSGVMLAVVFKVYGGGKITGAIRSNPSAGVAADLAKHMGGGGHAFASGFKIEDGKPFNEVKSECIFFATQLLDKIGEENTDETIQHLN